MDPTPTEREMEILKVLWRRGEASVRDVYEEMRPDAGIAQNTVQAFLRTMEEKGLVKHRSHGRTFIYRPVSRPEETRQGVVQRVLNRVFDGAVDQLVQSALSLRPPSRQELDKLQAMLDQAKASARRKG
jgi:BlaI family transcriptional regulator, penicillinase repressor